MPGKYTLSDTIYKKYLQDVKELFTSKLLNLIEEIIMNGYMKWANM